MATIKNTAVKQIKAVNKALNKRYGTVLPTDGPDIFQETGKQLRTSPDEVQNAYLPTLINLVGMQKLKLKRVYNSPFKLLHQGEVDTFDIQLIMLNVMKARRFKSRTTPDEYFEDNPPKVGTQYIQMNVQDYFDVSYSMEQLYGAFLSEGAWNSFVDGIADTLFTSTEMLDTEYVLKLLQENAEQGNIYLIPASKVVDQATALEFTSKLKSVSKDMAVIPAPKYNLSGFHTWTPKDEGVVITDTDTQAVVETYSLAWAFSKSYLELEEGGQALTIPNDSIDDGNIFGFYADKYAFEIHPIVGFPKSKSREFEDTLRIKQWLHYWAVYAMSFFNNVVAFADKTKIDNSAVAGLGLQSGLTALNRGVDDKVIVSDLTVTDGYLFDKFGSYTLTGSTDSETTIEEKSGMLHVGKLEQGTTAEDTFNYITVTWTSHLDPNITASLSIKINS